MNDKDKLEVTLAEFCDLNIKACQKRINEHLEKVREIRQTMQYFQGLKKEVKK